MSIGGAMEHNHRDMLMQLLLQFQFLHCTEALDLINSRKCYRKTRKETDVQVLCLQEATGNTKVATRIAMPVLNSKPNLILVIQAIFKNAFCEL